MGVTGGKNQISEDVFDFMISYLPFTQKSIHSELAKLFSISICKHNLFNKKQQLMTGSESFIFIGRVIGGD